MSNSREQIDVIYVEDDVSNWREPMQRASERDELIYHGVGTLEELRMLLNEKTARVFVVDGKFPEKVGKFPEFNAPRAIDLIRKVCGESIHIIVLSGEEESCFSGMKVEFHSKDKGIRPVIDSIRLQISSAC